MIECKQCRHYRLTAWSWLIGGFSGYEFATCASPQAFIRDAFAVISRKHDIACGPDARFFAPRPLGRSHGVDWDRAGRTASMIGAMRRVAAKIPGCEIDFDHRGGHLSSAVHITFPPIPRTRFTVAEYLAALTTDYCATRAAE
jgi:hypothetical protein